MVYLLGRDDKFEPSERGRDWLILVERNGNDDDDEIRHVIGRRGCLMHVESGADGDKYAIVADVRRGGGALARDLRKLGLTVDGPIWGVWTATGC